MRKGEDDAILTLQESRPQFSLIDQRSAVVAQVVYAGWPCFRLGHLLRICAGCRPGYGHGANSAGEQAAEDAQVESVAEPGPDGTSGS